MEVNSNLIVQGMFKQKSELEKKIKNLVNDSKFQKISNSIESNKSNLEKALENLDKQDCPIKKDEHLWGLIKSLNTEGTFVALYDKLKELSKTSYNAIDACNKNMKDILDLMKILVTTEKDIYDMIDKNELSLAETSNIIKEICRKANIKDETIEELFSQTFQRSYTLRDRIRQLRYDLEEKIDKLEQKFINLDKTIENRKNEITVFCEQAKNTVQEQSNSILINYKNELSNIIQAKQTQLNEIQSTCTNIFNKIKIAESDFYVKLSEIENELCKDLLHFANEKIEEQNKQIKICQDEIEGLKQKSFLDSYIYKIIIGLTSISALVLSLI